ncbi:FAD-dependent oxidoreductase [Brachybacterium sp. DNPG3]
MRELEALVVGAGQAGLSAAHHLRRRGVGPIAVLDAEAGPGGAWRHRWDSLTMATVNGIAELPGMPIVPVDEEAPANLALPAYFASYEALEDLRVERPVRVIDVRDEQPGDRTSPLIVRSIGADGRELAPIRTRTLLNATGTWTRPFVPAVPGARSFRGRQLRTVDYTAAEDLAGLRIGIVGGGISALGFLLELAEVAEIFWYTRREPVFADRPFTPELGREAVAGVAERVARGLPVRSVVSATGLAWTPALRKADRRGILARRPMFPRIVPEGVVEADGTVTALDAILWATGFRHELRHLRALRLHGPAGGIRMDGTAVAEDPRIHLLGYGPSASTIGANRAGRAAVAAILERTPVRA